MFAGAAFAAMPFAGTSPSVEESESVATALRFRVTAKRPDFTRAARRQSTP